MSRRTSSLDAAYFDELYRADPDPWDFSGSAYEAAKYDRTLAALNGRRSSRALEVGCSIGVLTARLAGVCDRLLAVDVSGTAVKAARRRCAELANVEVRRLAFPGEPPPGDYDLVVLSEVAYYWDDADLGRAGALLRSRLQANGRLLLVHWTGETDYPQTGDEAVEKLAAFTAGAFEVEHAERAEHYRLDLWRRSDLRSLERPERF